MTKASDNVFPRFLVSEGGSTATPAAAQVTVYAKADGLLYQKDDAGTETLLAGGSAGSVATDAIWDAAGDTVVGSGANTAVKRKNNDGTTVAPTVNEDSGDGYAIGSRWLDTTADKEYVALDVTVGAAVWVETTQAGGSVVGFQMYAAPPWLNVNDTASTDANTDRAFAMPVILPASMYVRAAYFRTTASGAGTYEWGLFDVSATPTSATKVAGGSGTFGTTGWQAIAATGAPDLVPAGAYVLIINFPDASPATIVRNSGTLVRGAMVNVTYVWDDTPDLTVATGGWSDTGNVPYWQLIGDMDASGTQWAA